nr:RHS repeat-associated core domain-containing protein [Hahella sp. HN01]
MLSQARSGDVSYYVYDGQGSVRSLTSQTGDQTDSYHYDAFGILLHSEGDTPNSYLYTGEQYDASLDQYYLRARYYDQNQGRFTQMDTWPGNSGQPITLNKYLYANSDPIRFVDPSGKNGLLIGQGMGLTINGVMSTISVTGAVNIARTIVTRAIGSSILRKAAVASALYTVANQYGDEAGDFGRAVSIGISAFNKWTNSDKYRKHQDSGHYVTTQGASGLTKTPVVQSSTRKIPGTKINWTHKSGGKPGRVIGFEYKLGKNGSPTNGSAFSFRIDYQDYVQYPPPGIFRPHYHLCMFGVDCSKHYYFDEVFK